MRRFTASAIIFMVAALVGPLLYWAIWPPDMLSPRDEFIVYLTQLLWPTQPLGVIEHNSGTTVAVLVAIGANILLFGLIGLAVGATVSRRILFFAVYMMVSVLICLIASWASGFDLHQIDLIALATALIFYGILFGLEARFAK